MNRILLIVALLVAWAPATAFADYDARKSEAMAQLDKAEMTAAERAALKKALETYFGGREDCFEGLIAIVAKADESPLHTAFRDRVGVCAVGASQVLSRALADIKEPSKAALDFSNVFSSAEATFYNSLRAVLVAEARDRIVVIRLNLADMTEALDGKWEKVISVDDPLDERAKKLVSEIRVDLDTVILQAAEARKDAVELIAEGVKQWAKSPTSPTPTTGNQIIDQIISLAKPALGEAIQLWQNRNKRALNRASSFESLFASETRVLVMFVDAREEAKEFLETNDFPLADAEFAKAKSSLDGFVSSAKTSGQSSDASELRDDLMAPLTKHLKEAADVYARFVSKHKGRFVGALGPDIEEELTEHKEWDTFRAAIGGYRLDATLRAWHQNGTNYFNVDLEPLSSDARDRLKNGLRGTIDQLLKELKVAEDAYRVIDSLLDEERKAVANKLK